MKHIFGSVWTYIINTVAFLGAVEVKELINNEGWLQVAANITIYGTSITIVIGILWWIRKMYFDIKERGWF